MKRRDFITLLGGAAASMASPPPLSGQEGAGRPLIGVLSPESRAAATGNMEALHAGCATLDMSRVAISN